MRLQGDFIGSAEWRRKGALVSYVSFVMKFFAIHQIMEGVSVKTKSPSLNLFSSWYPQTQQIKSRFP
jgi:hypothetical protein